MEAWHPSDKHSRWHRTDCIKQILQLEPLQGKKVVSMHCSKLVSLQSAVLLLETEKSLAGVTELLGIWNYFYLVIYKYYADYLDCLS